MLPLNRREIIAGTAANGLAPAAASADECLRPGMNWETMSPEQRDLAYNNVAAVGADYAKKKAEEWAAASMVLRQKRSHVNDALKFTETEVQTLSPMRLNPAEKPVSITYGTDELPFMIASSRDYHAYRAERHLPGDLVPVPHGNHMTMLDELRKENGYVMRAVANLAT